MGDYRNQDEERPLDTWGDDEVNIRLVAASAAFGRIAQAVSPLTCDWKAAMGYIAGLENALYGLRRRLQWLDDMKREAEHIEANEREAAAEYGDEED